jgi:hypothetical protein
VANSVIHSGRAGTYLNPQWLELRIASGGFTVNGNSAFYGYVFAPNGTITIAGNGELSGGVECDRLSVAGGGLLSSGCDRAVEEISRRWLMHRMWF